MLAYDFGVLSLHGSEGATTAFVGVPVAFVGGTGNGTLRTDCYRLVVPLP